MELFQPQCTSHCKVFYSQANLSGADHSGADLRETDLRGADLNGANLSEADLRGVDLSRANLSGANLSGANLSNAELRGINLSKTDLSATDFSGKDLSRAILREANLSGAHLSQANLSRVDLCGAKLNSAILVGTKLEQANLTGCSIHGVSVWNVQLEEALQSNLIITDSNEPVITVDNLKVAQFIYLLLTNKEIREVIDTITSKVVLILGRFTPERKSVLEALRDELRKRNYSPVLFDFEKPTNRDLTETISTLAHMARFVIADLTDAKSIPQELDRIIPDLPSVPIQPVLYASAQEYSMFEHFARYPWVLSIYHYHNTDMLLQSIQEHIIDPAEKKARELAAKTISK